MRAITQRAADIVYAMCQAAGIPIDPPKYEERYATLELSCLGLTADFFIRSQSVGFTAKHDDKELFYDLQRLVKDGTLEIHTHFDGQPVTLQPHLAGEGRFDHDNPCTFYLAGIASGNLKGRVDHNFSHDPATFEARANFLAALLYTQWITKMMPHIRQHAKRRQRLAQSLQNL